MSVFRKLLLASGVVAVGVSGLGQAQAQQTTPSPAEPQPAAEDEVVITGSRIKRDPTNSPTPLIVVGQEDLLLSGEPNVIDFLADVPALSASTVPEDTTGANLNDGGLSLLNLRDLGSVRTLVLVDGRRHVGAPQGSLSVDVDTIPTLLVNSIEIVTGGQSAVYGADAVSGVVNFLLKRDYDGFDIDTSYAQINQDGQYNGRVSALVGKNLFDDRLNVYLSAEYQENEEVKDSDVDFRREAYLLLNNDTDPNSATPDNQLDNILLRGARDAFFQRGGLVLLADSVRASALNDPDIPFAGTQCGAAPTAAQASNQANIAGTAAACFNLGVELNNAFVFGPTGTSRAFNFGILQDENGASRRINVGGDGLNTGTEFSQGSRIPESEAQRFQGGINLDVLSNVQFFAEAKYVKEETFDEGQPTFFQGGIGNPTAGLPSAIFGTTNFNIGNDNPFLDPALRTALLTNMRPTYLAPTATAPSVQSGTVLDTRATFNIFGPVRTQFNTREVERYVAGFRGDFDQLAFINDFSWEIGWTHGETKNRNTERGVDVVRFAYALDAVTDTAGIVNGTAGQTVCRVRLLRAMGTPIINPLTGVAYSATDPTIQSCTPQSVFGVDMRRDGFNPAAENYFNASITVNHLNRQQDWLGFVSGDLWDFWGAGPIGFAAGYEYRKEKTFGVGRDAGTAGRLLFLNTGPDFRAFSYDAKEWFVEGSLPLFKDFVLGEYAEISGAYREADYSTFGKADRIFSVQSQYRPWDNLLLRGTYGEAFRVPNIGELAAPATQTFANNTIDPCDRNAINGQTASVQAARRANCMTLLGPNYSADPTTGTVITYVSGIPGRNSGNPNLEPETSRSFTWSAVWQPDFAPGLSLIVDYYDIKIRSVIAAVTLQQAANNCVSGAALNPAACSTFTRNGFIGPADPNNFRINDFIQGSINYAATAAKGVDFGARYARDFGDLVGADLGTLDFRLRGNYLIRQEDFTNIALPSQAAAFDGLVGLPRVRFLSTVSYSPNDKLSLIWDWDFQASQEILDERTLADDADNRAREFLNTGAFHQHDFALRYEATDQLSLRAGLVNAFDEEPAIHLGSATSADNFDLFGRRFFIGLRYTH